jgi:hypothetical protein
MQEDITLSADRALIEKARLRARACGTALEDELQRWLESYAAESEDDAAEAWFAQQRETMERLRYMDN